MLSVIIPVYNIPKTLLERCVNSVMMQKGIDKSALEVILVDDGSTDECGRFCDECGAKYPNVMVVHKENGGLSSARNYGKKYAKGNYITFLDADDWVESDFYASILSDMINNDAEIGIGGMCADDGNHSKIIGKRAKKKVMGKKEALIDMYTQKGFIWSVCDKVYESTFLQTLEFDENILFGEDSLFSYQSIKNANKISYSATFGYHYFMRESSMTHVFSANQYMLVDIYQYIYDDVKKNIPEIKEIVFDFYITVLLGLLKSLRQDKEEKFYSYEVKIKDKIKSCFFRIFSMSKVLTIKDRIAIILAMMPKSIYNIMWNIISRYKK